MRVLIFSLSYYPLVGGAEVAIKEITSRISTNEIEWDLVTLRFDKSHPKFEKVGNVNVHRIGGGLGYLSKIFFVPQAAFWANRKSYDLYWGMMTYMLFPIVLLRFSGKKAPYVLTLQDGDPFTHVFNRIRIALFKPLLTFGFKNAFKVQTISNFLAGWAKQMGYRGNVEVIPNGVDVERFKIKDLGFKNDSGKVIITTSRLVEKNGVGDVIEAMKFLNPHVKFKILGVGSLEKSLKLKVKSLKLENRVEFLGFVPQEQIPNHLHNADVFVRPSLSEGQGISFIEAMAAGLPVVATPVGGIPDFLEDGVTGLFCEPHNPRSIAEAVDKILNQPDLAHRLIQNGQKLVREHYDWDLIAEDMKNKVLTL